MKAINIFIAYSHEDQEFRDELMKFLLPMQYGERVFLRDSSNVQPGQETEKAIGALINNTKIILLLLSPDSMGSKEYHEHVIKNAIMRHEAGTSIVIPIILRNCFWEASALANLEPLPINGKPIDSWTPKADAWKEVANKIGDVVKTLEEAFYQFKFTVENAFKLFENRNWTKAREAFENALMLYQPGYDPGVIELNKGITDCLDAEKQEKDQLAFAKRQDNYNRIVPQAEKFFALRKWHQAKIAFQDALAIYETGFDPMAVVLKDRIEICNLEIEKTSADQKTKPNEYNKQASAPETGNKNLWRYILNLQARLWRLDKKYWQLGSIGLLLLFSMVLLMLNLSKNKGFPSRKNVDNTEIKEPSPQINDPSNTNSPSSTPGKTQPQNNAPKPDTMEIKPLGVKEFNNYIIKNPQGQFSNYAKKQLAIYNEAIKMAKSAHDIGPNKKKIESEGYKAGNSPCDFVKDALRIDPKGVEALDLAKDYNCGTNK